MNLAYKHDIRLCQRFNKLIIAYLLAFGIKQCICSLVSFLSKGRYSYRTQKQ